MTLDPFAFLPGVASRVMGLGGNAPGHDPTYVFHTPYVKTAPGTVAATIRFEGLVAKRGTLVLRIHVLPAEPGAHARLVNSERIVINRLLTQDGEVSMQFEAYRDMTYAVLGQIPDNTDARADGLSVKFECQQDRLAGRGAFAEARSTTFGSDRLKPSARLISVDPATFAHPVSQMCTAAQFDEPAYGERARQLGEPVRRDRRQWEQAYVLQVLKLYGMLEADARGIGFGIGGTALPMAMADAGIAVTVAIPADAGAGDEADLGGRVAVRAIDLEEIPHDLANFDFAWSSSVSTRLGSIAAGLKFLDQAMDCLRPNGIAVHIFDFDVDAGQQIVPASVSGCFRRRDVEQAALGLISRGHEVAEVKLDSGRAGSQRQDAGPAFVGLHVDDLAGHAVTSFGLIARKAAAPL